MAIFFPGKPRQPGVPLSLARLVIFGTTVTGVFQFLLSGWIQVWEILIIVTVRQCLRERCQRCCFGSQPESGPAATWNPRSHQSRCCARDLTFPVSNDYAASILELYRTEQQDWLMAIELPVHFSIWVNKAGLVSRGNSVALNTQLPRYRRSLDGGRFPPPRHRSDCHRGVLQTGELLCRNSLSEAVIAIQTPFNQHQPVR